MKKTTKYALQLFLFGTLAVFVLWVICALLTKEETVFFPTWSLSAILVLVNAACLLGLLVLILITADKLGKERAKQRPAQSPQNKAAADRGTVFFVISFAVAAVLTGVTKLLAAELSFAANALTNTLLLTAVILPLVLTTISLAMLFLFKSRLGDMKVAQANDLLEAAKADTRTLAKTLRHCRVLADLLAALLVLCGITAAVCGALVQPGGICILTGVYAFLLLLAGLCRIRTKDAERFPASEEAELDKKDYPNIFALAEQAKKKLGVQGDIRIFAEANAGISVAEYRGTTCLILGVLLLNLLSEDELYRIFLHEFSHISANRSPQHRAEYRYAKWEQMQPEHFLVWLTQAPFVGLDAEYEITSMLWQTAVSVQKEFEADRAMAEDGNAETAASALLKCSYYDFFRWEDRFSEENENVYRGEAPPEDMESRIFSRFSHAASLRGSDWNRLNEAEILSKTATHPTIRMRLEAFGIKTLQTVPDNSGEEYRTERANALAFTDKLVKDKFSKDYEATREREYLQKCRTVETWEQDGCPVSATGYADVFDALWALDRTKDAEALCDQAIAELPPAAAAFAGYWKGAMLLHRYDDGGIEHIYRAIEQNENYTGDGLELIGAYCCRTGNAAELERYRACATELLQQRVDHSRQNELKKNDDLFPETGLPASERAGVIAYITTMGEDCLEKLWLARKTADDGYFFTAVILKLKEDTAPQERSDLGHAVFEYLDTVSDWNYCLYFIDELQGLSEKQLEACCVFSQDKT